MVGQTDSKEEEWEDTNIESPSLTEDFYRTLLDLPACAVTRICDNCGRCEH